MAYVAPKLKWKKPKKYRSDVIATAKASGCVLQFWNSLLVGDELTILSIVADDEYEYLMDAIYDTSNIEEWKNFRFNYRVLSRFIRELWSSSGSFIEYVMSHATIVVCLFTVIFKVELRVDFILCSLCWQDFGH